MDYREMLSYLQNAQYEQLGGVEFKKISEMNDELENSQFDSTAFKFEDAEVIKEALEICRKLLKEATVWKVEFGVMKNRHGEYENGGTSYFWKLECAENFIKEFKKTNDGWTSFINNPEEVPLDEADDVE